MRKKDSLTESHHCCSQKPFTPVEKPRVFPSGVSSWLAEMVWAYSKLRSDSSVEASPLLVPNII